LAGFFGNVLDLLIYKSDILPEKLCGGKDIVAAALKCPFCESEEVRSYGTSNGKSGMPAKILNVLIRRFTRNTAITGADPR
jgi:hypothetical protein